MCIRDSYYAVFSWASTLRARDPATFRLIWGTPAFICTTLGYGLVSLAAYALAFWSPPYAEPVSYTHLDVYKRQVPISHFQISITGQPIPAVLPISVFSPSVSSETGPGAFGAVARGAKAL